MTDHSCTGMKNLKSRYPYNSFRFDAYPAGREAKNLLGDLLEKIHRRKQMSLGQIADMWKEILGEKYALMTQVQQFHEGILTIKVHSAPLFSILKGEQKTHLEKEMRKRVPSLKLKKIHFRR